MKDVEPIPTNGWNEYQPTKTSKDIKGRKFFFLPIFTLLVMKKIPHLKEVNPKDIEFKMPKARFFVMKSYNEANIFIGI